MLGRQWCISQRGDNLRQGSIIYCCGWKFRTIYNKWWSWCEFSRRSSTWSSVHPDFTDAEIMKEGSRGMNSLGWMRFVTSFGYNKWQMKNYSSPKWGNKRATAQLCSGGHKRWGEIGVLKYGKVIYAPIWTWGAGDCSVVVRAHTFVSILDCGHLLDGNITPGNTAVVPLIGRRTCSEIVEGFVL